MMQVYKIIQYVMIHVNIYIKAILWAKQDIYVVKNVNNIMDKIIIYKYVMISVHKKINIQILNLNNVLNNVLKNNTIIILKMNLL